MNKAKFLLERENKKYFLCLRHADEQRKVMDEGTLAHELAADSDRDCQFCRSERLKG